MSLIKISKIDKIEIVGDFNHVQCRQAIWVEDNGVIVGGKKYNRYVIAPSDDVSSETKETRDICAVVHTKAIKDAYKIHSENTSNL